MRLPEMLPVISVAIAMNILTALRCVFVLAGLLDGLCCKNRTLETLLDKSD